MDTNPADWAVVLGSLSYFSLPMNPGYISRFGMNITGNSIGINFLAFVVGFCFGRFIYFVRLLVFGIVFKFLFIIESKNKIDIILQKNPDLHYIYKLKDKSEGIWHRYYVFKVGKSNSNNGHIICFSDKIES